MDIKRFSSPKPTEGEPIPFELAVWHWVDNPDREHDDNAPLRVLQERVELFHARPDVSGGVLVQVELMTPSARAGSNARGGDALFDFFDAMLVEEDVHRFRSLIEDKDTYVHASVLSEIALEFYKEYANRPTQRPGS